MVIVGMVIVGMVIVGMMIVGMVIVSMVIVGMVIVGMVIVGMVECLMQRSSERCGFDFRVGLRNSRIQQINCTVNALVNPTESNFSIPNRKLLGIR